MSKNKFYYNYKSTIEKALDPRLIPVDSSLPGVLYATTPEHEGLSIIQSINNEPQRIVFTKAQVIVLIKELQDAYDAFFRLTR